MDLCGINFYNYLLLMALLTVNINFSSGKHSKDESQHNNWVNVNVACPQTIHIPIDKNSNEPSKEPSDSSLNELKSANYSSSQYEVLNKNGEETLKDQYDVSDSVVEATVEEIKADFDSSSEASENSVQTSKKYILTSLTPKEINSSLTKTVILENCDYLKLGPGVLYPSIERLKIRSHGTLEFSEGWAEKAENLTSLNIKSTHGLVLPSGCAIFPPSLHKLDVSYAPVNKLSIENNCLPQLRKLILRMSSIQKLSLCLPSLRVLDVSWNSLDGHGIEMKCENAVSNVTELKLHNNKMETWTSCDWPSVVHVELQENALTDVKLTACPLQQLTKINLSNNKLRNPPDDYPNQLTHIDLSQNLLEKTTQFPFHIQEINLSHNHLKEISKGTFRIALQLVSLDLSYNQLTIIHGHDFKGLLSLRTLDLSHNAITRIRHEAFLPMTKVLSIKINDNSLRHVDAILLDNLPEDLHLQASNNPWHCSCTLLMPMMKLSRTSCAPNCKNEPKLKCREGGVEVTAERVLRPCMNAVGEDSSSTGGVNMLPAYRESDEDKSEERPEPSLPEYYVIIPVALLLLGVPLVGFGIRKLYFQRKNMKRWCRCLSFSSSTNRRWLPPGEDGEDSETEF